MGRKPSVSRLLEKQHKNESRVVEPESNNPSLEKVDVQPENTNTDVARVEKQEANYLQTFSRKKVNKFPAKVRRSGRLQNSVMDIENRNTECIPKEITISESEREDEPADEELPDPTLKDLHEKFEYIVQLLKAQQKIMDAFISRWQAIGKTFCSSDSGMGEISYKSLYIDSQKKIEALTEENHQLNRKLEFALGKIEVYEKGNHAAPEVLGKLKDLFKDALWLSSLTRVNEATRNCTKRKRLDKVTNKN